MRNKGAVWFFTIALALVSIYQLSFSLVTRIHEKRAANFAKVIEKDGTVSTNEKKYTEYIDSISNVDVYNLGLWKYNFRDCKERELSLGLDLKGGMNVTLEVSIIDLVRALSDYNTDTTFNKALVLAQKMEKESNDDFLTLFAKAMKQIDPNARLAAFFSTPSLNKRIPMNSSNEKVLAEIRKETDGAVDNVYNIIRTRIDKFGVIQPNIQKLSTSGRILVELPGIKEPERVRKLLQGSANLEIWVTYDNGDVKVQKWLKEANDKLRSIQSVAVKDTTAKKDSLMAKADTNKIELLGKLKKTVTDSSSVDSSLLASNPLFSVLSPYVYQGKAMPGAVIGISQAKDTAKVNSYLNMPAIRKIFPSNLRFAWDVKAMKEDDKNTQKKKSKNFRLYALRGTGQSNSPALGGDAIADARPSYSQNGGSAAEVDMTMNPDGANVWAKLTSQNVGKCIAIVLDGYVYSAPRVIQEIKGGNTQITGDFTYNEASDLANVLKSGKMPVPARIIEENVVGPSLGKESISAGLTSFIFAFIGVLLYMGLYYSRAGMVANIALFANVFFLFGVFASMGLVLTLPGIAGIILTLAMAVDGNVIIYERMREEVRAGKTERMVVKDGFWHAYSSIIDGHVTTILTGIVLFIFGSAAIKGFATSLIVGLLLSLFSSIFIARLMFEWMLDRSAKITLGNRFTINTFTKANFDFLKVRKIMYVLSGIIITIGIISLFIRGLDPSVDFKGGRTFIVQFDKPVTITDVRSSLTKVFGSAPEVKTIGTDKRVKISTKYLIDDKSSKTDSVVDRVLYEGLKSHYQTPITYEQFSKHKSDDKEKIGELSSTKIDPVVSNELIYKAFMAVFLGLLIIFIYIAIRFKNWKYSIGGVASLAHDTMVVITAFTLFYGVLPFSLEVDQQFIATLLTVIGYSIMDTVIIYDRIREYNNLYPKRSLDENINSAINHTLGRTINTSGITIVVLLIMFVFGGEILRGFIFALLVGVGIGTYSSVFNATPIAYDVIKWTERRKLARQAKQK
jgi:SecD/SecF fusion protein